MLKKADYEFYTKRSERWSGKMLKRQIMKNFRTEKRGANRVGRC